MTEEQNKLAELVALSEKATQGEWINVPEDNVIYTKELGYSIATIYTSSIVCEEERNANAALATALVNWFRANLAVLRRESATEAVLEGANIGPEGGSFVTTAVPDPYGRTMAGGMLGYAAQAGHSLSPAPSQEGHGAGPVAAPEPSGEFAWEIYVEAGYKACERGVNIIAAIEDIRSRRLAASPDEQKG